MSEPAAETDISNMAKIEEQHRFLPPPLYQQFEGSIGKRVLHLAMKDLR
jgi:hypothetical protein